MREAAIWSLVWVGVSFVFMGWLWWHLGGTGTDAAGKSWNAVDFPKQNMNTYTVGFTADNDMLSDAAAYGQGRYYQATDSTGLNAALQNLLVKHRGVFEGCGKRVFWGQSVIYHEHPHTGFFRQITSHVAVAVGPAHDKATAMKVDQGVERLFEAGRIVRPNDLNRNVVLNAVGSTVNCPFFSEAYWEIGFGVEKTSNISGAFSADWATMRF